ncbi:T7SS effector LXG polymorphic toxin [Solibacillus sp. FSL W7-1472]|uniref:T7SS effector LXG polymorphic toxin n=1 Tax=Solibacillus sp. FSL W7-1472 TaxID=2921707 RepID=UPI0030D824B0
MKVLDVNEFQQGLERTVNQLTRLESEMKQIESAVQGLTQLEESLKGQGGEALRAYYESCHLPFITFFNTFKTSFTSVLQEMKTALSSLEPDSSGFIRQAALEGEIEQGLNRAKQVTEELTDEANNIMDQVSDIVSLPKLDDSEVHLGVHDAKRHRDETVEKLIEFDVSQTDALTTIQTDLMHMKTWITNIETMMTEGVTDVNFPAEQWQSFASQNPLMIALAYRTQSLDQVINMNPLFNPGGIGGANPYTLPGLYQNGQQPLVTFGLSGAMVSTNFVSFMKQKEKEVAKELSATATTVDNVKDEGNGFLNFLGDVGSGATKVGKGLLDFLLLDDVNTLADKNASGLDKGIALASFIPIGKVLKIPKAIDKIVDSNVGEVVKKSDVDEVVGKGNIKHLPRIKEVEVNFKRNDKHDSEEFARQLKDQEKGMNELTVDEYLKNREKYIEQGRAIEGNAAQQAAREKALNKKIEELFENGMSWEEAEKNANSWLKSQAALHNPDQIAGGKPLNIGGMGDKRINSSIGSQWKYRIDIVDEQIGELTKSLTSDQRKNTYLNVKLTH